MHRLIWGIPHCWKSHVVAHMFWLIIKKINFWFHTLIKGPMCLMCVYSNMIFGMLPCSAGLSSFCRSIKSSYAIFILGLNGWLLINAGAGIKLASTMIQSPVVLFSSSAVGPIVVAVSWYVIPVMEMLGINSSCIIASTCVLVAGIEKKDGILNFPWKQQLLLSTDNFCTQYRTDRT